VIQAKASDRSVIADPASRKLRSTSVRWWPRITQEQPEQLKYQARTSRVIPVVVFDLQG
jgi:hypothetical protein